MSKWALGGVAVLIVCGLAGGVAAGVWFAAGTPGWPKRARGVVIVAGSVGDPGKLLSPADLAAHPFWKVKVTAGQVEGWVKRIAELPGSRVVFIDDRGRLFVDEGSHIHLLSRGESVPTEWLPEGMSKRWVMIDLQREFRSRPNEKQVLDSLAAGIRVREYQD